MTGKASGSSPETSASSTPNKTIHSRLAGSAVGSSSTIGADSGWTSAESTPSGSARPTASEAVESSKTSHCSARPASGRSSTRSVSGIHTSASAPAISVVGTDSTVISAHTSDPREGAPPPWATKSWRIGASPGAAATVSVVSVPHDCTWAMAAFNV